MSIKGKRIQRRGDDRMPVFLPILLIATLVYLLVEISFASFLVDLLGGKADPHAIERAEQAGRIISGVALALAVWGMQIPKLARSGTSALKSLVLIVLSAAICISGVYYGERWLVDEIVAGSPTQVRQHAVKALAVREEFFVETPSIIGIDVPPLAMGDDSWNAFRGLFPFISLYDDQVLSRNGDGAGAAIDAGIAANLPDRAEFSDVVLSSLFEAMEVRHDAYIEASRARSEAVEAATRRIKRGWDRNVDALYKYNVLGPRATRASIRRAVPQIRRGVQNEGIPVPNNWNPTDQETFQRAAWGEAMPSINGGYNEAVDEILGRPSSVQPDIVDFDAFLRHESVQKAMLADLGLSGTSHTILPGTKGDSLSALHQAYVGALASRMKAAYGDDPAVFRRGGEFEELGKSAVRSLVVPPMALFLSLLGAVVHLIKSVNYAFATASYGRSRTRFGIRSFLRRHPKVRFLAALSGALTLLAASYSPASAIVDSDYYQHASQRMQQEIGAPIGIGLDWTISMQRVVAPAGDLARAIGVFSPIEGYLVDGSAIVAAIETSSERVIPFPLPRPERFSFATSESTVPMPRPRPDR